MSDNGNNQQNNGNNQQNQQKQKGGGGGGAAGVSLSQNYTSASPEFGKTIGGAVCDSLGYVCAAAVSCLAVRGFNWVASKFRINPINAGAKGAPLMIGGQQQGVHPMQMLNDTIANDPAMARKMQNMLNQRLAAQEAPTVEVTPEPAAPVVEEFVVAPQIEESTKPEPKQNNQGGGKNKNK